MSPMQNKIKSQQKTALVAMGGNLESEMGPPHVTLGYALASLRLITNSLLIFCRGLGGFVEALQCEGIVLRVGERETEIGVGDRTVNL